MPKAPGSSMLTPFGSRIFTMEDWLVRIKTADGRIIWKGVQPDATEETAIRCAVGSTYLRYDMIADVQIMRRSERLKVQA